MTNTPDNIYVDALIIGRGPAGIQAALYIARSGLSLAVAGYDAGSLALAESIENYYGLPEPVTGAALQQTGEKQAKALGAALYDCQVVGFGYDDSGDYIAMASGAVFHAKTILIATGAKRVKVPVKGIDAYEGKGVSYCAVCDGFLYRGKKAGVLGHGEYAFSEAGELAAINGNVAIFTNGERPDFGAGADKADPAVYEIVQAKIKSLEGGERLSGVRFEDGSYRDLDGLFIAYGTAGGSDLARKLGVVIDAKGNITADADQATNVPGVYAAGDCTGVFRQIAVAAGQGAIAARSMISYVRNLKK